MPGAGKPDAGQLRLFGPEPAAAVHAPRVRPAPAPPELQALAERLPPGLALGASSWWFPGWEGLVYARACSPAVLAREGLGAYAQHPLLGAVGLDRTLYGPLDATTLAGHAAAVPARFRFLAMAHQALTLARLPPGDRHGRDNPLWLDVAYATERVVRPFVEGLGDKAGVLLLQLSPQDEESLGGRHGLPDRLHRFLAALPRGPCYAVELRDHKLLTPAYVAALRDATVLHCVSVHPRMPDVRTQARQAEVLDGPGLVVRWTLNPRLPLALARRYYHPFDTLVDPDLLTRDAIAELVRATSERGRPSLVIVDNEAEGSAPRSIEALARTLVGDAGLSDTDRRAP